LIVYSKVPVKDRRGRVIGIAGIHREIEGFRAAPKTFGRLSRAVQIIHQRYAEPLSTLELAKMTRLSRSQFDRHFRRLFGTTPREYLLRVRINAACRLLADTDRKTTDIALATGFYDHSHFSRTFCRIMGASPRAYRRQHAPE
jgi:transcriptional regulator GlxA family with amidase domain